MKKQNPKTPIPPPNADAAFEAVKENIRKKWLAKFPPIIGDHEAFVKHPSIHFGTQWFGWSLEKKTESYGWYLGMVKNWKGATGKPSVKENGFYSGKKPAGLLGLLKKQ